MERNECKRVILNIRHHLKQYIEKWKLKSLILGVSGGIDSALCAVLAKPVCDELSIPLIGHSISIVSNKDEELERARNIGDWFCHIFKECSYDEIFRSIVAKETKNESETDLEFKIRLGNIKARLRMIHLYNAAQKYKGIVLSTDNYTEYLLGFCTLHGDVGDYGMIQNLWKMEVYSISKYMRDEYILDDNHVFEKVLKQCIDAVPTDGLGITDSDIEQLGVNSYFEVDIIFQAVGFDPLKNSFPDLKKTPEKVLDHPIIKRYLRTTFKRNNPFNISRQDLFKCREIT